jgi:hypothetical protein
VCIHVSGCGVHVDIWFHGQMTAVVGSGINKHGHTPQLGNQPACIILMGCLVGSDTAGGKRNWL